MAEMEEQLVGEKVHITDLEDYLIRDSEQKIEASGKYVNT